MTGHPAESSYRRRPFARDTGDQIVTRSCWWLVVLGWLLLIPGTALIVWALIRLTERPVVELILGIPMVLAGVWFLGWTTKITFDQPPGYMTVTRGQIPLFLWFRRTRRLRAADIQGVFFRSFKDIGGSMGQADSHDVMVVLNPGRKLKIHDSVGGYRDEAEQMVLRIEDFIKRGTR